MAEKTKWELLGEHFGYPECCITAFHVLHGAMGNPLGASVCGDTGFIPCPDHAKKILIGELKLEDLINGRKHSLPFPVHDTEEALNAINE